MDLKQRLAHLGPPRTPVAEPMRHAVLDELRAKMAAILDQPVSAPRPRADPSAGMLPFVCEQRPEGVLYRRSVTLAPSHHVGRIPVDAAFAAEIELLSLLSLDTGLAACRPSHALYLD